MREVAIDRSSTAQRVADALRTMMFEGELTGDQPLRETALAGSFGVARSTVREALSILWLEGLVTRSPGRGAQVAALSPSDVEEIFTARAILEGAGVDAARQASPEAVQALRDALDDYDAAARAGNRSAATVAHLDFHSALVGLLGSRRLLAASAALTRDLRLALAAVGRRAGDAPEQIQAHRRLLELVAAGDTRAAAAELASHLDAAKASLVAQTRGASESDR
ncbi:MAG TPA: GntR family transcriptional regulator [Actinomycetes bacterium]|nr:GntR family transcriptional regulator [Actinomycetes bacterium]